MTQFKGTQGEWKKRYNETIQNRKVIDKYIEIIAPPMDGKTDHINCIAKLHLENYDSHFEDAKYSQDHNTHLEANAQLIITAPELLTELIGAYHTLNKIIRDLPYDEGSKNAIREHQNKRLEVINKATNTL